MTAARLRGLTHRSPPALPQPSAGSIRVLVPRIDHSLYESPLLGQVALVHEVTQVAGGETGRFLGKSDVYPATIALPSKGTYEVTLQVRACLPAVVATSSGSRASRTGAVVVAPCAR